MIKHYILVALRNFLQHKFFSLLNVTGLSIGILCFLFISLYLQEELTYDAYHQNADRIYRVALELKSKTDPEKYFAVTAAPLAPTLQSNFAEIQSSVRLSKATRLMRYEDKQFYEKDFFYADASFFDVFSAPLLMGDSKKALTQPNSVVLSQSIARKYFGEQNPLGKILITKDSIRLMVTAVARDAPANSHFHFDILCSLSTYEKEGNTLDNWWNEDYYTYILTRKDISLQDLEKKIAPIAAKYIEKAEQDLGFTHTHFLQPLQTIHLHSDLLAEIETNGNITYIYIFSAIALFMLLIACINFMNLSTARSSGRAKEVGIRKVIGAARAQLIAQFIGESVLLSFLALSLALVIEAFFLEEFNELTGKKLSISSLATFPIFIFLICFGGLLGTIAGSYPAFYLSAFQPITVLKGKIRSGSNTSFIRQGLVVFQFCICFMLIVGTLSAWQQLQFMQNKNLGLQKEQVISIPLRGQDIANAHEAIKNDLMQSPHIMGLSYSSATPGGRLNNIVIRPEGVAAQHLQTMQTLVVDYAFFDTYQITMAAGRAFSKQFYADDSAAFVLNEAAVKELGWGKAENAIGKSFEWGLGKQGTVIGVVKDFHFNSLQQKIPAIVMHISPSWHKYLSVRLAPGKIKDLLPTIQQTWKKYLPAHPFEYSFVDEDFAKQYEAEERLGKLTTIGSLLTIFIACLGLFGLTAFSSEQRTKEIGMRKVLGASILQLVILLSKDFTKLVVLAIMIATPLTYFAIHQWLENFAYRIDMSVQTFFIAGLASLLIAWLTLCYHVIKVALANPIKGLRSE